MQNEYTYDMILKKLFINEYALFTVKGIKFCNLRSRTEREALDEARAVMSSWTSVRIRTEEQYEQDQERN